MAEKRYTSFDELPLTLTVPEVAEVLDIGRNTAYEIVRSGARSACSNTIWSGI